MLLAGVNAARELVDSVGLVAFRFVIADKSEIHAIFNFKFEISNWKYV
jgi:hypothetical protein